MELTTDPKDCKHIPIDKGMHYDGATTECSICHCTLRYNAPGQGKVNKSKKQRRFEKTLSTMTPRDAAIAIAVKTGDRKMLKDVMQRIQQQDIMDATAQGRMGGKTEQRLMTLEEQTNHIAFIGDKPGEGTNPGTPGLIGGTK